MARTAGSKNKATMAREQAKEDALKASGAATVMDFTDEVEPDEDEEDIEGAAALAEAPISNNDLAKALMALTEMQRQNLEGAPIRKVPISKFKTRSPFNPTGKKGRKLKSRFYQNGGWVNTDRLTDKEIGLFNTLSDLMATGQTIRVKEMLSFSKVQNGGNIDLHLLYKNKSNDDKLALKSEFRHLVDMLEGGIEVASTSASQKG